MEEAINYRVIYGEVLKQMKDDLKRNIKDYSDFKRVEYELNCLKKERLQRKRDKVAIGPLAVKISRKSALLETKLLRFKKTSVSAFSVIGYMYQFSRVQDLYMQDIFDVVNHDKRHFKRTISDVLYDADDCGDEREYILMVMGRIPKKAKEEIVFDYFYQLNFKSQKFLIETGLVYEPIRNFLQLKEILKKLVKGNKINSIGKKTIRDIYDAIVSCKIQKEEK